MMRTPKRRAPKCQLVGPSGEHRRLRVEDVLEFKEGRDKDRRAGLRELSQMTQWLDHWKELIVFLKVR
jgi:hypothetical protein